MRCVEGGEMVVSRFGLGVAIGEEVTWNAEFAEV